MPCVNSENLNAGDKNKSLGLLHERFSNLTHRFTVIDLIKEKQLMMLERGSLWALVHRLASRGERQIRVAQRGQRA